MTLFLYIFLYCISDNILNNLYLSNYSSILDNELICYNENFHYSIFSKNIFAFLIYLIYIIKNFINYDSINDDSIVLSSIYLKYTLNILLNSSMTFSQYESSRNIMWLFSTPLMLKMYCDVNSLTLKQINIYYHIVPIFINIFMIAFKNSVFYYFFVIFASIMQTLFIKTLYNKKNLMFTNIYLFIWTLFICLGFVDIFNLINKYDLNLYYSYADLICKMMSNIIVNDFNKKELTEKNNLDLQSVQFMSFMIKNITNFKKDNAIITAQCNNLITSVNNRLLIKIPVNKVYLEKELLKKILPFNFDKSYLSNSNLEAKQFDLICVLFTDIVSYTELAYKYDDKTIFHMLNCIYYKFDNIIKKYPHLQKIETIGDAYMVVGDIFRNKNNHDLVVKEIILFAIEIIQEIKNIKTPDNVPLCIRIGINIGNVSVGILGNEIPRLCVVGNTVNMAARLQSTADIDTIQLSEHIHTLLKNIDFPVQFDITKKDNVFLKNLGSVTTYNINSNKIISKSIILVK